MYTVKLYTTPSGNEIVRDYYLKLPETQRSKILKAITILEDFGISREIPNLRKLSGTKLWEYRILGKNNIRIVLVSIVKEIIMILNIFIKKSHKTPIKELKIAIQRYNDLLDM